MLYKLSKNHEEWLRIAYRICGNKEKSKDLVQDMYIKMHECNKTYDQINKWYVYRVMVSIFINERKRKKIITIPIFESIQEDDETLLLRKMVNEALNELDIFEVTILLESHEQSLRKTGEKLNMNYNTVNYRKKNALKKLKETNTIKEFKKS